VASLAAVAAAAATWRM